MFILPVVIKWYFSIQYQSKDITELTDLGTFDERIKVWSKTFELIYDNFLWGVGNGNWRIFIAKYSLPEIYRVQDLNVIFQRPHNEYLKILSENGIIGFLIFNFFLSYTHLSLFRFDNKLTLLSAKIIFSVFFGFMIIMFFSFPLERIEHGLMITFLLSIILRSNDSETKKINFLSSKKIIIIILPISLLTTFVFQSRYKSSYYLNKMYKARNIGDNEKTVYYCDLALSPITKHDDFSIPVHWYRGNANASMEKFKKAFLDFKLAQKYHPYNPHVLNDLGSAYVMENKIDTAIYFYKSAAKINPRFDDPKLNLVAIYLSMNDIEKAKVWEDKILHDSDRRTYYRVLINEIESGTN